MANRLGLLLSLVLGSGPLGAQIFSGQRGYQWWHDQKLYSTEDSRLIEVEAPKQKPKQLKVPEGRIFWIKDGLGLARIMNPATRATRFLKTWDWARWEDAFHLGEGQPVILGVYPLDNGKVFLSAGIDPFVKGGKVSFWAIAKPDEKGLLSLEDLPDFGFSIMELARWVPGKEPWKPGNLTPRHDRMEEYLELGTAKMVPCAEGFVLLFPRQGKILVFNGTDGHLIRQRMLFPSVEQALKNRRTLERAILACRPMRSGNLLLATRSEDAVLNSRVIFEDPKPLEGQTKEEFAKEVQANHEKNLEAFGEILWWEFNPMTGDFLRRSTPKGLPSRVLNMADMNTFSFRMNLKNEPELQ